MPIAGYSCLINPLSRAGIKKAGFHLHIIQNVEVIIKLVKI